MSKQSNVKNFFDYVDSDDGIVINGIPLDEFENPDYDLMPKIVSLSADLYMRSPKMFITLFNQLVKMVKLNIKIKETYKTKDERKRVYSAMSFFDKMVKKQSYDEAYEIASNHYKIPERYLRSIIGTRNNLKRNYLKMKDNRIKLNL